MFLVFMFVFSFFSAQQSGVFYAQEGAVISGTENVYVQDNVSSSKEFKSVENSLPSSYYSALGAKQIAKKKVQIAQNTISTQKRVISSELDKKIEKVRYPQKRAAVSNNFKNPVSDQEIVNNSLRKDLLFTVPLQNHYCFALIQYSFSIDGIVLPSDELFTNASTHGYQSEVSFSLYNRPPPVIYFLFALGLYG